MIIEYRTGNPKILTEQDKQSFLKLLKLQNQTQNPSIEKINTCPFICIAYDNDVPIGIGAIKQGSKVSFENAEVSSLKDNYDIELGYMYVLDDEKYRSKGIAKSICTELLTRVKSKNVFATTEECAKNGMKFILQKNGFTKAGKTYIGSKTKKSIGLYLLKDNKPYPNMINTNELDNKLDQLSSELQKDYKVFTSPLKLVFAELFEGNHYCYANGIKNNDYKKIHGENEFMFDFIAVEEERQPESENIKIDYITRMSLAMESELSEYIEDVIVDFQKLLISNADEKAMVFKCHSDEYEKYTTYLNKYLSKAKVCNGRFHFIAWINDEKTFKRKTFSAVGLNARDSIIVANISE